MKNLELILMAGILMTTLPACKGKDDSSSYQRSTSSTKQDASDEKKIIKSLDNYFDSSKSKDFKEFWNCFSSENKANMLKDNLYALFWTGWVVGEPKFGRVNSIAINGNNAIVNLSYSCKYPGFGYRMNYDAADYDFVKEGDRWFLLNEHFNGGQQIEKFEPYTVDLIKPELP